MLAIAMFVAFARERIGTEFVSLGAIAIMALGLYLFPMPASTRPTGWRWPSAASATTR